MTKTAVIAASALILTAAVWIITLNIKLSSAKTEILTLTAELARKDTRIAQAEAALERQNEAAEKLRAEAETRAEAAEKEYGRLNRKYGLAMKKAAEDLGSSPGCEARLKAIYEAQEAWCYER